MKKVEGKYKVFVGPVRPNDALLGYLEKGNHIVKGTAAPCNSIGGMQIVPNRSVVWGIRLDKNGKKPNDKLQANDKAYNGQVDFVDWGTEGGMPITTRYKSGANSIDYDYQVLQLGMKTFENDIEECYLEFAIGENTLFDSEEMKKLFVATMHENVDSISKHPDVTNGNVRNVKLFETHKESIKNIDKTFEAGKIVRAANSFEHLKVLKMIIADKTEITYDESNETSLYENILLYANQNTDQFLDSVQAYDGRVSDVIERFRSFKAFDWTTDGRLMGGQDRKQVLLEGIDAKGEEMVQYIFDNRMEPEVATTVNRMIVIAQNFK